MNDKEKTAFILRALKGYYTSWGRSRTNIIFPELRLGSGYCGVAQRRIDLFVISSNAGNETTAFEIKVSKQDFKKDLNNNLKQRGARLYANKFYYVTPKGLLKPEDIPLWAGLMEIDIEANKSSKYPTFSESVPAPLHSKAMPSWGLICSMIRHVNKDNGVDYQEIEKLRIENAKFESKINLMRDIITEAYKKKEVKDDVFLSMRMFNYIKREKDSSNGWSIYTNSGNK